MPNHVPTCPSLYVILSRCVWSGHRMARSLVRNSARRAMVEATANRHPYGGNTSIDDCGNTHKCQVNTVLGVLRHLRWRDVSCLRLHV